MAWQLPRTPDLQGAALGPLMTGTMLALLAVLLTTLPVFPHPQGQTTPWPYPPSRVIQRLTWHWTTRRTAAPGSDLWPVTWGADNHLYAAWGDGGGFGGTDQEGRVALGFARLEGPPERFAGININGGRDPEHRAAFPKRGKTGGMLAVGDRLYAWLNTQNGPWPDVDHALIWSDDKGATWKQSAWVFPKGPGRLKPATFLNFGKGYAGVPTDLQGYVYFYGQRQGQAHATYLGRAPQDQLPNRRTYEFLTGGDADRPVWSSDANRARPVFADARPTGDLASVVYVPALERYLLTAFHKGPGQLGIFDAPHPWGPWTTVAYYDRWAGMGPEGEGLTCSFPAKWMSADGRTLWCIFSAYGKGAKQGIDAHDRFNLVRVTLELNPARSAQRTGPAHGAGLEEQRLPGVWDGRAGQSLWRSCVCGRSSRLLSWNSSRKRGVVP